MRSIFPASIQYGGKHSKNIFRQLQWIIWYIPNSKNLTFGFFVLSLFCILFQRNKKMGFRIYSFFFIYIRNFICCCVCALFVCVWIRLKSFMWKPSISSPIVFWQEECWPRISVNDKITFIQMRRRYSSLLFTLPCVFLFHLFYIKVKVKEKAVFNNQIIRTRQNMWCYRYKSVFKKMKAIKNRWHRES